MSRRDKICVPPKYSGRPDEYIYIEYCRKKKKEKKRQVKQIELLEKAIKKVKVLKGKEINQSISKILEKINFKQLSKEKLKKYLEIITMEKIFYDYKFPSLMVKINKLMVKGEFFNHYKDPSERYDEIVKSLTDRKFSPNYKLAVLKTTLIYFSK